MNDTLEPSSVLDRSCMHVYCYDWTETWRYKLRICRYRSRSLPTRPDTTRPGPTRHDSNWLGLTRPEPTRPEPIRPDEARPDRARPGLNGPVLRRPGLNKPSPIRPGPTRPEPTHLKWSLFYKTYKGFISAPGVLI